jgi:hypothetical protein
MKYKIFPLAYFILFIVLFSCKKNNTNQNEGIIQLISVKIGTSNLNINSTIKDVSNDQPILFSFSSAVDTTSLHKIITIKNLTGSAVAYTYSSISSSSTLTLTPASNLQYSTDYNLAISSALRSIKGETFPGVQYKFTTLTGSMVIDSILINGQAIMSSTLQNIDPQKISIKVAFSQPLDPINYKSSFLFTGPSLSLTLSNDKKTVLATNTAKAKGLTKYTFSVSTSLTSEGGFIFGGFSSDFYTAIDSTYQFAQISDNDLMTLVQQQTFKYFWDFGHPSSGMARERNSSGDVVTTGGSGFGIMAMIVAMERGFITRADGMARLDKILSFLETSDRFHGVWPHWLNGVTGKTVPFSAKDNGGDIVETSYMLQGLLCMRQYLNPAVTAEKSEIDRINNLYNSVEFDWFTNGEKTLYWEWSPELWLQP